MQLLAEGAITVSCSVDDAYRYATNLENFGQWFPAVIEVASADALPHATPGKEYLETVSVPLRGHRNVRITVTEAIPGGLLVTHGSLRPLLPRMEMLFVAVDADSCRITWRMLSRNRGIAARILIVPLARRVLRARAMTGLDRLRQRLERPVPV